MYNKLFNKIVDSSIWMEPDNVRIVWLMFIAIMDEDGFVNLASSKNVAHRAVMDLEKAQQALTILEGPDPESSNPANEGRRITRVPGGWIVNNAKEYRDIVRREQQKILGRERVQKHRHGNGDVTLGNGDVTGCNAGVTVGNENVTPSEAEAETNTEVKTISSVVAKPTTKPVLIFPCNGKVKEWELTEEQVKEWAELFPGVDVLGECMAALAWVKANQRKTAVGMPKFLVGWLGRQNNQQRSANGQPRQFLTKVQQQEENMRLTRERLLAKEQNGQLLIGDGK